MSETIRPDTWLRVRLTMVVVRPDVGRALDRAWMRSAMIDTGARGERRWFLLREGRQFAPFTWAELQSMARAGRVGESDVVWAEHDGVSRWAGDVAGLLVVPWWRRWWLPRGHGPHRVAGNHPPFDLRVDLDDGVLMV